MKNKYGYFSDDYREFIITDPMTPRPWFNYMWNQNYAGLISHTGGGFSYLDCPRDNRISRMRYNCLPWDRPGRYVILKDTDSGEFWSLSWAPTISVKYDKYECRHGQGYTAITTIYNGIEATITYFVPRDRNAEVWYVSIKNVSGHDKKLEVYGFQELMMGNALNDIINQPNDKHFTEIRFDKDQMMLKATRRYWVLNKKVSVAQPNIDWKYELSFTTSLKIEGFDGSLDKFIGKWRSEANPISVETGKMSDSEITAGDPVAALKSSLLINADSKTEFSFVLAIREKSAPENDDGIYLRNPVNSRAELQKVKEYWTNYLSHVSVKTPDEDVNLMLNVWNQYQTAVTFDMARNSGYYHGGLLFGTGIRDQFQDILGVVIAEPDRVRNRLLNALKFQFSNGSTLHNFFKMTGSGEKTNHSDTPLWIPFGLIEYLNETGDLSIFKENVSFYDEGDATVYDHMVRALDFCIAATTERGMPKIMNGDWNDTLDHIGPRGKGETVWGAFFLAYVLKKSFEVIELHSDGTTLERWKSAYEKLGKVTNDLCWDGEWYLRAFRDNGKPVGSKVHNQGKIFLNTQTWSVISGLAPKDRAKSALDSCKKYLETPFGMQIVYPAYREIEDDIGLISRCVPGKKENGAVFNHASSWFILASILAGNNEDGFRIYKKMLPVNSSEEIDKYEVEPYVFAEYITSPEHETANQASHSWLTGTAVWMYRIALDHILGFRTSASGFMIKPNIPAHWDGFTLNRRFRGKDIMIVVNNRKEGEGNNNKVMINGSEFLGDIIQTKDFTEKIINIEIDM